MDKNRAPMGPEILSSTWLGSGERLLWHFQTPVLYWINFSLRDFCISGHLPGKDSTIWDPHQEMATGHFAGHFCTVLGCAPVSHSVASKPSRNWARKTLPFAPAPKTTLSDALFFGSGTFDPNQAFSGKFSGTFMHLDGPAIRNANRGESIRRKNSYMRAIRANHPQPCDSRVREVGARRDGREWWVSLARVTRPKARKLALNRAHLCKVHVCPLETYMNAPENLPENAWFGLKVPELRLRWPDSRESIRRFARIARFSRIVSGPFPNRGKTDRKATPREDGPSGAIFRDPPKAVSEEVSWGAFCQFLRDLLREME